MRGHWVGENKGALVPAPGRLLRPSPGEFCRAVPTALVPTRRPVGFPGAAGGGGLCPARPGEG